MTAALLADIANAFQAVWRFLVEPLAQTPWRFWQACTWRDFWLREICDQRFVVVYFLPLVGVLLLLRRDRLRIGIILTGLVFLAYVFGVLYAAFWLLSCIAFYRLAERFAVECRRTDVLSIGPPLAAGLIIAGWFLGTRALHALPWPADMNVWLHVHARWLFPLGARGLPWEPSFPFEREPGAHGPASLLRAAFWHAHFIGTAYLTVRLFCYFADIQRGALPAQRRSLLGFLAYTCYAPALIQGPIERFGVFQSELDTCHDRRSWRSLPPAAGRIALGLAKSLIGTLYLKPISEGSLGLGGGRLYDHPEQIASFALLYFGPFLQLFHLYLEFSGYCDVAAGIARLIGYRQIENFDWPWAATSMRDLWRRWHISLSGILRDYVYIPLGGNRRHTALNLCVTFALCGLWHEPNPKWGLWGVVMGLMVAVNQYWAQWMKRLDGAPAGTLPALRRSVMKLQPLPRLAAWVLTVHAFVFSITVFAGGSGAWRYWAELLRRIWQAF